MIRMVGFGGEPATGKSLLMRTVVANWLQWTGQASEVKYGASVFTTVYPGARVMIFGNYEAGQMYGGTDRLSMSVQPELERVVLALHNDPNWDGWQILWEGDRLWNGKFLRFVLASDIPARFFVLKCSEETLKARHAQRLDSQDEKWLSGRRTKVHNITEEFGLPVFEHNTPEDTARLALLFSDGTVWDLPAPALRQELAL